MTNAEYFTYQFYTWEQRGRGWILCDNPVYLEPPFIPFVRHLPSFTQQDDSKRPTVVSKFLDYVKGTKPVQIENDFTLDYEEVEPFIYDSPDSLKALQIKIPKERKITPEIMKAFLLMLSYSETNISFEIIGNDKEIVIQFVGTDEVIETIQTQTLAYFPNFHTILTDHFIENIIVAGKQTAAIDFGLQQEFVRPLAINKNYAIDPLTGFIGILDSLGEGEQAGLQIIFQGALNNWAHSMVNSVTMQDGTSFFEDDPQAPKIVLEKLQTPLFGVTIRAFGQSESGTEAIKLVERISYSIIHSCKSATNQLILLPTELYDVDSRMDDIYLRESHRLGMLLSLDELVTIVHFPSENIISKKLFTSVRKTKELPSIAKNKAFVLGENYHNGIKNNVTFSIEDRLKHTHIIGATGTGKSTLIANLIIQDIHKGHGIVLFDPHGDLVDDVIASIPPYRIHDVVLVDPSDTEYSVGLNILQAYSDVEKEVLSSDLVAAFRKYSTSWGDQMNAVFGNAILAVLENSKGGTLNDIRRFLIEKEFRQTYLKNVTDPSVLYYWQKEYPLLKTNSIGPILTRLDTFLRPKAVRNMVIQQKGLDFENLLNTNKIILLKLSQGLIGTENSFLLGSLILSKIHQAIFRRQQQAIRNPILLYLDEFQNFITPSIKEMLSGIRKYNVGLTLSHQDLQQLQREDSELLNSVLGNINTRIVFRVGEPDAKKLQDGFADFDFIDLQNLGRGEAIIRIEQPQYDCSLDTYPPQQVNDDNRKQNIESVITYTRANYASPKSEVEKILYQSLNIEIEKEATEEVIIEPKIKEIKKGEEPKFPKEPSKQEIAKPIEKDILKEKVSEEEMSTHRYLQTLIKKMAESKGYITTIERSITGGSVDVELQKDGKVIAIEICNTTDADWEMHNIQKCLAENYHEVISVSGDLKQLERIKKRCIDGIPDFESKNVLFFTPDVLFQYLDQTPTTQIQPQEQVIKGYRVNVSYENISQEEMLKRRKSIAQVVKNSLRKKKN